MLRFPRKLPPVYKFKNSVPTQRFHSELLLKPLLLKQGIISARFIAVYILFKKNASYKCKQNNSQKLPPLTDCIVLYYCIPFYFVCVAWVSAWSTTQLIPGLNPSKKKMSFCVSLNQYDYLLRVVRFLPC